MFWCVYGSMRRLRGARDRRHPSFCEFRFASVSVLIKRKVTVHTENFIIKRIHTNLTAAVGNGSFPLNGNYKCRFFNPDDCKVK